MIAAAANINKTQNKIFRQVVHTCLEKVLESTFSTFGMCDPEANVLLKSLVS